MPYNYLLDAYLLSSYQELINDSIIIFDEAHNVAQAACEGRSLVVQSSNIEGAIAELSGIMNAPKVSENMMNIRHTWDKEISFILKNLEDFQENMKYFAHKHLPSRQQILIKQLNRDEQELKMFHRERTDESLL